MQELGSMPNPLSDDNTKNSSAFGLKTIKDCYYRWKNGYGHESWATRKKRFDYNRSFAMGKQSTDEYRDIVKVDGQLSVINLDYTPLPIAIPILNRVKDRYNQRFEKIVCNSIDPFTQNKKKKAKEDALFKLKNKDKIMALQQSAGVQLEEFSDNDPQDEQELELEFGFNYKEREEVIMQNLIDIVYYDNRWSKVLKDVIFDNLINCGYAVVKNYLDGNGRIKHRIVKPDNFITSYSEFNDFRDWQWQGEVYYMDIAEIRLKYPEKVKQMGGEQKLYQLAKSHSGKYDNGECNYEWSAAYMNALARPYDSFRVQVVDLTYKTLYNLKYEKNTDRFGKELLDKTNKIKEGKEYEQSKPYYVSYDGCWIVDTEHLLEWGLSKNMIKPEENLVEIYSPYSVYMYGNNQMTNTPLIETMIPLIKQMQLIHLQTQKIIATTVPDGNNIDVTGLSDIDMGAGIGIVSPMQLYGIYLQTGDRFFKGLEDSGEGQRQPPITQNQTAFSNKLEQLEAQYQAAYSKLVTIVGSNSLDSGMISNQAVGQQVFQDARKQGESASNYIYNSYLNIMENDAKITMMRGWDILVYGKKGYDGYRQALGTDKVEYLRVEATDDFEKTNFDVKIEAVIDDTEQQLFEQNAQVVLAGDPTMLPDITEARRLAKTNVKYATAFLMARYKKRRKESIEEARINAQTNTEQAIAAAQAKSKGDIELETVKAQLASERERETLESQKESELMKFSSILKVEVAKAILAKEGSTPDQLPEWIMEGLDVVAVTEKQLMAQDLQDMEQQAAMEEQAMMEEQMMQEQQMQQEQPMQ